MNDYVYIMWCNMYPLSFKLGISNNPKIRAEYIERSLPKKGRVYVLLSKKIVFSFWWEQLFHALFFWCNTRFLIHRAVSGRTEFFFIAFMPFGIAWVLLPEFIIIAAVFVVAYLSR